jgi:DsrE/DsrF/DrsH-like family
VQEGAFGVQPRRRDRRRQLHPPLDQVDDHLHDRAPQPGRAGRAEGQSRLPLLEHDSGVHLYACKATADMFGLTIDDFVPQVEDIISVGELYEKAAGGEIIFT